MSRPIYNVTLLLRTLKVYSETPGKKKFQKLVYLVENIENIELGFDYDIHYYGPYSSKLDSVLTALEGEGLVHYDYQGNNHYICVDEPSNDTDFCKADLTENELEKINSVFSLFGNKSPNELELLTTAHFAFQRLQDKSVTGIIRGVKK